VWVVDRMVATAIPSRTNAGRREGGASAPAFESGPSKPSISINTVEDCSGEGEDGLCVQSSTGCHSREIVNSLRAGELSQVESQRAVPLVKAYVRLRRCGGLARRPVHFAAICWF
jgi:hypothetical protein